MTFEHVGVFDLETTGIDVENDRVVTAYVGVLDRTGAVVQGRSWLADPGIPIPERAAQVHGITTERARAEGRAAAEVVTEVVAALAELFSQQIPVVAHNAPFDFTLLAHDAQRNGVKPLNNPTPVIDPLVVDKALDRYRKGKRTLDVVAQHYGVVLDDAHNCEADAVAAGRVTLAITDQYAQKLPQTAAELHAKQVVWAREQAESLGEYFVRVGKMQAGETLDGRWPVRLGED